MKTIISSLTLPVIIIGLLSGCYYDEVAVFDELPNNVSLKNDVQPILTTNCTTSGCHDSEASHDPSLVSGNAYDAMILGKYVNTLEPEKSLIYLQISSGSMPPSGPISINEQKIILAWITQGAKNN